MGHFRNRLRLTDRQNAGHIEMRELHLKIGRIWAKGQLSDLGIEVIFSLYQYLHGQICLCDPPQNF